ncbi:MAG: amidohydrolase family protein [Bacteroidota bacterium]
MDYYLQNAFLYDGLGGEGRLCNLLLQNAHVSEILPVDTPNPAPDTAQEIDLSGKWLCPGFIDVHTHYDAELEIDSRLIESVRHGITTVFLGSCGLSMVMGQPDELSDMFTRVEGIPSHYVKDLLREIKDWDGPEEYLQHLQSINLGPNVACFLGHSTLRSHVMGLGRSLSTDNIPDQSELEQMDRYLHEALDAGYMGLSVNLLEFDKMDGDQYRSKLTPSVYAGWKEYRYLFKTLRQRDRILQTIPNTANPATFFSFIWESRAISKKPLKTTMLAMIDGKTVRGIHRIFGTAARFANRFLGADVKFQGLPEPFDVWTDGMVAPFFEEFEAGTKYIHLMDLEERAELVMDPHYRKLFRKQWQNRIAPRVFHRNLYDTRILECPDPALVGRSFKELAQERKQKDVDVFLDLVAEHGSDIRWYSVVGNDRPKELNWIIQHPDCHIGFSDAGAHLRNMGHYNFPLRLFQFVQEQTALGRKTLSMGEAVKKVSSELADWFGLDAGRVAPGQRADLVVIDPQYLDDRVNEIHEAPMPDLPDFQRLVRRHDELVPMVMINGKIVWQDGAPSPEFGQQKGFGKVLLAQ